MKTKRSRVRVSKIFLLVFFCAFLGAMVKLIYVSISDDVDGKNLTTFASSRNTIKKTLYASRGNIYDINGEAIAQNVNSYTLIAYLSEKRTNDANNPQHVVDKEMTANALSLALDMDYDYVLERLSTPDAYQVEFGVKGKNLSENQKVKIEALGLPGIDFIAGSKRYYKKSKMASYIVGYAKTKENGEIVGEMGIESAYNDVLKGTDGYTEYQMYKMDEAITKEPISGSDIYLTIDTGIQLILEDAVHTLEENNEFAWFTFTVMDAKSGAIIGSASSPNFNPNDISTIESYVNPLVGYTYEPGSTMKIYSWLAAMENGLYNGSDEFDSGSIKVADVTIRDYNNTGWGRINYDKGFAYSSNVGATNLALKVGNVKLREFYESLGFGAKTGIELPGEETGVLRMTYESELASASFGQGITTTPIQNLQALSIITNDGEMLKPYIVDKIVDENGNVTYQNERTSLGKKVSTTSINKIKELMYDVVYNGATSSWRPNNIILAGKTGTAQIASPTGGYLQGAVNYTRSFAGFFPYEDPEYIFYVSVKQISGGASALSNVVVSSVESIANYAALTDKKAHLDTSKLIKLPSYISSHTEEVLTSLTNQNLNVISLGNGSNIINQFPNPGAEVYIGSKIFLLTDNKEYIMPDITGWSSSEVMNLCNIIGLKYTFTGYGKVSTFNIEPNSIIDLNTTLEINLST